MTVGMGWGERSKSNIDRLSIVCFVFPHRYIVLCEQTLVFSMPFEQTERV